MGNLAHLPAGMQAVPTPISEDRVIRPGEPGSNLPTAPPESNNIASTLVPVLQNISVAGNKAQQPQAQPYQVMPFLPPEQVRSPEELNPKYAPYTRRKY